MKQEPPHTAGRVRRRSDPNKRRVRRWRMRRKVILAWSALFAVIAIGVMITTLVLWLIPAKHTASAEPWNVKRIPPKRVPSRFGSPTESDALKFVQDAMTNRDPAQVGKFFHLGEASAESVVGFLAAMESSGTPVSGYNWVSSMDRNGLLIDGVAVEEGDGTIARNRLAMLTPDENGVWKIDFDSFARTCHPPWDEVFEGKAETAVVRAFFRGDTYYNRVFGDDSQWVCFRLISPDSDENLLGYCRIHSPQFRAMGRIASNAMAAGEGQGLFRAVLELRRVEGADPRQFEISRVLAEDWVMSGTPFDVQFK